MSPSHDVNRIGLSSHDNPFRDDVVGSPWDEQHIDLPEINGEPFNRCVELAGAVASTGRSTSIAIFGEPGSGKTHLLARLRKALQIEGGSLFVAVRMATSGSMVWRHLRRTFVSDLLRRTSAGPTHLDLHLRSRTAALNALAHRDLAVTLEHVLKQQHVRDASAWLRGEQLPASALARLDLSTPADEDVYQEEHARIVVEELCDLIAPSTVVICLDQIEAIQTFPGDLSGPLAVGAMVSRLHDLRSNLLIVSCLQTNFFAELTGLLRPADADRMLNQNKAGLRPLTWEQAQGLIRARLDRVPQLASARTSQPHSLWPLSPERLKAAFEPDDACVARKVIFTCRQQFDQLGTLDPPNLVPFTEFLNHKFESLALGSLREHSVQETDAILLGGLPLLLELRGHPVQPLSASTVRYTDLLFAGPTGLVGITLCNQSMQGLARRVRSIRENWSESEVPGLRMLRDARLGIGSQAHATRLHIQVLQERGARFFEPSSDCLAMLDAARKLLGAASSGNLSHNGETVGPAEVADWLKDHLPPSLLHLSDSLVDPPETLEEPLVPLLASFLNDNPIVRADEAAAFLKTSPEEITSCARRHPLRFGLLAGPPVLLFAAVAATDEAPASLN